MKTIFSLLLGWFCFGVFLLWALVDRARAAEAAMRLGNNLELAQWQKTIRDSVALGGRQGGGHA